MCASTMGRRCTNDAKKMMWKTALTRASPYGQMNKKICSDTRFIF